MLSLLKPYSFRCGPSDSLTSCKINKDKSCLDLLHLVWISRILSILVDIDVQNGVRSAGSFIHLLGSYLTVLHACIDDVDSLLNIVYWYLDQIFNVDFTIIFFSDIQVFSLTWVE